MAWTGVETFLQASKPLEVSNPQNLSFSLVLSWFPFSRLKAKLLAGDLRTRKEVGRSKGAELENSCHSFVLNG